MGKSEAIKLICRRSYCNSSVIKGKYIPLNLVAKEKKEEKFESWKKESILGINWSSLWVFTLGRVNQTELNKKSL